MKYLSFKVEVILVTGAWLIASGLVFALYFTATTPTEKFLSVFVLVLMLIAVGMYIQSAVQRGRNQKVLDDLRGQIEAHEQILKGMDER